jgi:hypothetical protein
VQCLCGTALGEHCGKIPLVVLPLKLGQESYFINEDSIIIDTGKSRISQRTGHAAQIVNPEKKILMIIVKTGETDMPYCTVFAHMVGREFFY